MADDIPGTMTGGEKGTVTNKLQNIGSKRRFGHLSNDERETKKCNVIPGNTLKGNNKAANTLKQCMTERGDESTEFELR